jgi:hypothetical protein
MFLKFRHTLTYLEIYILKVKNRLDFCNDIEKAHIHKEAGFQYMLHIMWVWMIWNWKRKILYFGFEIAVFRNACKQFSAAVNRARKQGRGLILKRSLPRIKRKSVVEDSVKEKGAQCMDHRAGFPPASIGAKT